ncbi:amidase [Bradyrhizobium sp. Leo121]|uniref:amidase n=1 Tax=Bradyrhizobium sp. Leo121 TaxID=1571195 RepID=UPI00102A82F7|nr:amidase [Bradyrhizobium sp. Leo121]RZN32630.1 amidase [Bradyrhizobium sp. Leo121]
MTSKSSKIDQRLAFASATELLLRLRNKEFSARALLEFHIERLEKVNGSINAVIFTDLAAARARADEADAVAAKGQTWGPLHGLPVTVKESNNVAGWPTTYGDPALKDFIAPRSAVIIDRLRSAGAIIFGKTNVPLNLIDWQSYNAIHGTTRNPWDLNRTPGGSSGGASAALAAGLTPLELGSDAGGSIRMPAHFCGVFGHKPTPGIVPDIGNERAGSLIGNDLVTSGPLARSVADLSLALNILAGPAGDAASGWRLELPEPRATRLRDFRISIITNSPVAEVDEPYRAAIRALAARLREEGASVVEEALPFTDHASYHATYVQLLRGSATARLPVAVFDNAVRRSEEQGANVTPYVLQTARAYAQRHRDWLLAEERRAHLKRDWADFFERFDVVIAPATVSAAFPIDETKPREERTLRVNGHDVDYNDQLFWAGLATLPSLPATAVPIGSVDGLPIGVQIIGPHLHDRTTLAFAAELERFYPFVAPAAFS